MRDRYWVRAMAVRRHEPATRLLSDLLFDEPDVGRCLVAPNGCVLRANAEWLRSTGFSLDDVLGADVIELFPDIRDLALAMHARARAGQRVVVPRHAVRADGREAWWEGSIAPVPMEDGTGLLITTRELTAQEVTAGDERYRTLVEVSPDAVFVNRGGRVSFVNPAMVKLFGASSPDQLVGKSPFDLFHPECHDLIRSRVARLMAGAKCQETVEERILRLDGSSLDVDVTAAVFDDERGRAVQVIVRDATARRAAEAALRESEMRLRRLYDSGMIGVLHFDLDGGVTEANDRFLSTVGYTRDDLVAGRVSWDQMTPPEYRHLDERAIAELESGGVDTPYEKEYVRKDGSRVPILIGAATYDERRHRGIAFVVDMSERKRAEEALRNEKVRLEQESARLHAMFQALPAGVAIADANGKILLFNEVLTRIWGGPPVPESAAAYAEWRGWWRDTGKPIEAHEWAMARALSTGEVVVPGDVIEIERFDGSGRATIINAATPVRNASGEIVGGVLAEVDITAQRCAEDALERTTERLSSVLNSIQDDFYVLDRDWTFTYVSKRFTSRVGKEPRDFVGNSIWKMFPAHVGTVFEEHLRAAMERNETRRFDISGKYTDAWYRMTVFPSSEGITVLGTDITEARRMEEALRAANAELVEADRRKTAFLAMLSHELRNPLAPIRNSIYLLERAAPDSGQAARAREVVRRQTEHLTRLLDDLLDLTRISHGKIPLERSSVDLREIVRRTTDDLHSVFAEGDIRLRVDHVTAGPIWIEADATRIAQVLTNLLNNSMKFTPSGGTVRVSVAARDGRAELCVSDDGIGMDPGGIDEMFEPFAQADESLARSKGGLGLGLALVKSIVELHGGTVEARSEGLGRGAEFCVLLPLADARAAREMLPEHRAGTSPRTILVIEDNVDGAQSLADILELHGHRVRIARDGRSGIALALELQPDVILCDIGLPGVDGYEVARTVRGDSSLRNTRLVALSGYAQPEDRRRAGEAGFDAHVTKPVELDSLMTVLAKDG